MAGDARSAALAVLERCRRTGAWSETVLNAEISRQSLSQRDAALAARLCYGVLQNTALCDYCIDLHSNIKTSRLEPKVLDILRLSVYQLLFLDKIPPSAAVNAGVELCKKLGYARAAGLVNAVLRRVAAQAGDPPPIPGAGTADYLAIRYSHPLWLVKELMDRLGYAEAEQFLAADNAPAPLTAQVNLLRTDCASLLTELGEKAVPHPWLPDCLLLEQAGNLTELPAFQAGKFYVQDAAARLSVMAAAPTPGMQVLDACAAPGGKSFSAAIMMENRGRILSCDLHEKKLTRLKAGAAQLGISIIDCRAMDARTPDPLLTARFDLIVADAPCSGLGVIRKKPEIRQKDPDELTGLPEIQSSILDGLSDCVAPGGVLLYSTCTIRQAENEDVVSRFVAEHRNFVPEGFTLPGPVGAVPDGMVTLWPHRHGTDGFFLCKLRKIK